jgi:hypothetical protein
MEPTETDKLELRQLVDAYALRIDQRDVDEAASLFTVGGRLVATFAPATPEEPIIRTGREEIAAALQSGLARYSSTTHMVGGHVVHPGSDHITGVTTCIAHHIYESQGVRRMLVMALHYHDTYGREGRHWLFAERRLVRDWHRDEVFDNP